MTETFDAVLAEVEEIAQFAAIHHPGADDALHDRIMQVKARLAAAHAAEVEVLQATLRYAAEQGVQDQARAEAAERDAKELRDTLREARRWIGDGDMGDGLHRSIWTPAYAAIVDRVDACIGGGEG